MRPAPFALLLLALVSLRAPAPAQEVVVKARATLTEVLAVARGLRVELEGNLRDNLGQPVPGQRLTVAMEGAPAATAVTDAQGHFRAVLRGGGDGARTLSVRFPGSALLGPAEAGAEVTLGRTAVELRTDLPETLPAGQPADLNVSAVDARDAPLGGLSLRLSMDGREIPSLPTDTDGRVRLQIRELGRGPHALAAAFAGDDEHLPARLEHTFTAYVTPEVTLDPLPARLPPDAPLDVSGRVGGDGRGNLPFVITANGEPVGGSTTDLEGRFRLTVAAEDLPAGRVRVRALAAPTDPSVQSAFSAEQVVEVVPPPPPSLAWVIVPVALGAVAAAGVAWRRRPPTLRAASPASVAPPPFVRHAPPAGDGRLHLEVRSQATGLPLPAEVTLVGAGEVPGPLAPPEGPRAPTGADGRATLAGPGAWLWVEAPGHAPEVHPCIVPPGGRVVVHLETHRARIQRRHEEVLQAAGRPVLRFGRETPAQAAADLVTRGAPSELVTAFTARVERGCFGDRAPDRADLRDVESDALALRAHFHNRGRR